MKKMAFFVMLLISVAIPTFVHAEEWYMVLFRGPEPKCEKVSKFYQGFGEAKTPADVIKGYRNHVQPIQLRDEKTVNGKVVQVTLIDVKYPEFSIIFYYGLGRCEAAFKAVRMEHEREEKEIEKRYGK